MPFTIAKLRRVLEFGRGEVIRTLDPLHPMPKSNDLKTLFHKRKQREAPNGLGELPHLVPRSFPGIHHFG